jgi:sarcosine oxidase subunit beta
MLIRDRHQLELARHRLNSLVCNGIAAEIVDRAELQRMVPHLGMGSDRRYEVLGAFLQRRGGTARHDAVAWGYARAADSLGVDIIQNCEVLGFERTAGAISAVETSRGRIGARRIGIAAAGHSSVLAALAGFRLPIVSYCLQAMVSEPMKPILDHVVICPNTGVYVNQSDKGELVFGGALDLYPSYAQRGGWSTIESVVAGCVEMFPAFGHLRVLRHWGGLVDVSPDSSPIIGQTPVDNVLINCGWGTGGFKATPAGGFVLAHALARDEPHPLARPFGLDRFASRALIDEGAAAGIAH